MYIVYSIKRTVLPDKLDPNAAARAGVIPNR